jgi:hypothetical protein
LTFPPAPVELEPTDKEISPELPELASPDDKVTEPCFDPTRISVVDSIETSLPEIAKLPPSSDTDPRERESTE